MTARSNETPGWLGSVASWLTPRRLRVHAILLAGCLWGVCVFDFATTGLLDRLGNVKFQDFLPFYVAARMIGSRHADDLYNPQAMTAAMANITPASAHLILPYLYGPQVGLFFVPLVRLPFLTAGSLWAVTSLLLFFVCMYLVWKMCPALRPHFGLVALSALAYPPLFHCFIRGQISALPLACFTAAFLALRANRHVLAGIALGVLVFKPQFLVAIPLVLLLARAWKPVAGVVLSSAAQLFLTWLWFGTAVMRAYFDMLWHMPRWIGAAELSLAPIQMHSLRAFWSLLIPWPELALTLYLLSSLAVISIASAIWKSASPLTLRFSALTLAAVLVNPHLFIFDLLVLAPALLLLTDWVLTQGPQGVAYTLRPLIYLAFLIPLLGPVSRWTHLQLSIPVLAAVLWVLWRQSREPDLSMEYKGNGSV